jgi:hypothetical protein
MKNLLAIAIFLFSFGCMGSCLSDGVFISPDLSFKTQVYAEIDFKSVDSFGFLKEPTVSFYRFRNDRNPDIYKLMPLKHSGPYESEWSIIYEGESESDVFERVDHPVILSILNSDDSHQFDVLMKGGKKIFFRCNF